ncbi:nucleoside-diphosphate kinase, partial [Mycobacterium kansasii]
MTERTLILIKPDGVRRGLSGEILARIERKGLTIAALELKHVSTEVAEGHYAEHKEKPFFGSLLEFITSGP